jgi:hypothetical protein
MADGVDNQKWIQSTLTWKAITAYSLGQFLVDPNGNIQEVFTAGTSGATQPIWNTGVNSTTSDGTITWVNMGSNLENWGIVAPTVPPTISSALRFWQPNKTLEMWYSIFDSNNSIETVINVLGPVGNISTITIFRNLGQAFATIGLSNLLLTKVGDTVTLAGLTTIPSLNGGTFTVVGPDNSLQGFTVLLGLSVIPNQGPEPETGTATDNSFTANTGTQQPKWNTQLGGITTDNGIQWVNDGLLGSWVATTPYAYAQAVLDTNSNIQIATKAGTTGGSAPAWAITVGATTTDGSVTWTNAGAGNQASTGTYQYAYAYHCVDGSLSTASPVNFVYNGTVGSSSYSVTLTGPSPADPQCDYIWIFRTVQGGSTLFFLDQVRNPIIGTASTWSYTDVLPDTSLNNLITAPIADSNDPPPAGITNLAYHLGRIFAALGNTVVYSAGPDAIVSASNGNTAFPPANAFVYPSAVIRMWPCSLGLLIFTTSDIFLIGGQGTPQSPLYSIPFLEHHGLLSYNAFTVNGSVIFMFTSDGEVVMLDPSSGVSEVGFPIGDQFLASNWSPMTSYLSWHISGSPDRALYVSDGSTGWFRLSPTPAPETGMTWSPFAQLAGGSSAIQSIETSPGVYSLLVGPKTSGPILRRNYQINTDNGTSYDAFATIGSLVLVQPGQLAQLEFITTDSKALGKRPNISVLLDEISGPFELLGYSTPDPTQLPESLSLYNQRFYFSQTQQPAICRNMQIKVDWGADTFRNEMLSLTLFGGFWQEI